MTLTERGVVFAEGGQVISELCGRGERQEDLRPAAVGSNLKKKRRFILLLTATHTLIRRGSIIHWLTAMSN